MFKAISKNSIPLSRLSGVFFLLVFVAAGCSGVKTAGDGPVIPSEKIDLWNGRDFAGWKLFLADENVDVKDVWSVTGDVIRCEGKPFGYMRTRADYAEYRLHVEWRWPGEPTNSGIFLHLTGADKIWPTLIECQLRSGDAGDFVTLGDSDIRQRRDKSKRVVAKMSESSEKPAGQWNSADIICRGDSIVVYINGHLQNRCDGANVRTGKIALQSEGGPIEFRNIYIEPCVKISGFPAEM